MVLKKTYLKNILAIIKIKKPYNDNLEKYNLDFAKTQRSVSKPKKPTIYWIYIEKNMFDRSPR